LTCSVSPLDGALHPGQHLVAVVGPRVRREQLDLGRALLVRHLDLVRLALGLGFGLRQLVVHDRVVPRHLLLKELALGLAGLRHRQVGSRRSSIFHRVEGIFRNVLISHFVLLDLQVSEKF